MKTHIKTCDYCALAGPAGIDEPDGWVVLATPLYFDNNKSVSGQDFCTVEHFSLWVTQAIEASQDKKAEAVVEPIVEVVP